jgi:hypothetical protein
MPASAGGSSRSRTSAPSQVLTSMASRRADSSVAGNVSGPSNVACRMNRRPLGDRKAMVGRISTPYCAASSRSARVPSVSTLTGTKLRASSITFASK